MKILVTGGAGFIGSHIVDTFIDAGHDVVVIDNLSTGRMENLNTKAKFYLIDIRSREVDRIFEIEKFDAICHQAAQMDVRKSVADPLFDADVNVKGSLNILQNCIKYDIKKFIFASTGGAVYGEQESYPCDETHPLRPVSPYGITKLTVEKYLFFYNIEYGLNYTILRYSNVYGPRQNPFGEAGVIAIFAHKLLNNQQAVINGDGKQTRDYIYVADVAKANLKALNDKRNEIYNIGTGVETDVNTIFKIIKEISGSGVKEKHGRALPGEQRRSVISSKKAEKMLDWKAEVNFNEGIKRTINFFRRNK